jgi:hypothetical protein
MEAFDPRLRFYADAGRITHFEVFGWLGDRSSFDRL